MRSSAARIRAALFLLLTFAFCSPAWAQVTVFAGGTGTTSNTGASGKLLIGQGDSTFLEKALSGDCTLLATGVISCSSTGSSIVLDLADDASDESTALGEIATTGDTNSIFTMPSADKLLIDLGNNWPTCDAATALAANGGNCSAGQYPLGVDASGAVESCTADDDTPDNDSEVPNGITVDLSASGVVTGGTASRCARFDASGNLAADTADCSSGAGDVTGPASSTDNAITRFNGTSGTSIQNSGCTIDDSGNIDCSGTLTGSCTPASSDCGMITDDNTSDHAAPGAGKVVWYSKSGDAYIRAGAAGAAEQICTSADIASCSGAGGDSISVDSVAVVDPDFQDGGDINFTDTSNVITATLKDDVVAAAEMADADHGDVAWATGVATVENVQCSACIAASEIADGDHGDFTYATGSATLDADVVAAAEMADADHGDVSWSGGVATVQSIGTKAITLGTLTDGQYCTYTAAGTVLDCNSTPGGTGDITDVFNCSTGDCGPSIALADGDLLDMSGVTPSAATEGIIIPSGTDCSAMTAAGQLCYDTDSGNQLCWGTGAGNACVTTFGGTIDDSELTNETFGDFTCSGSEDGCTLNADVVAAAEMADADHGDVSWSSGVATVENLQCSTCVDVSAETNLAAGAGVALTGDSLSTASSEADFLASGALTCGASTQGKMQVHTTPLQYCDNAATPTLQYAAYGNSSGEATAVAAATVAAGDIANGDHGDFTYASGVATLDADVVAAAEMADADHGDVAWSTGVATVENVQCSACIAASEIADGDHGDFTYATGVATLDADVVAAAEMADADHGDVSWSGGVATVDTGAVAMTELSASCSDAQVVGGNAGGTALECQTDDDVPESGDFGAIDTEAEFLTENIDSGLDNIFGDNEAAGAFDLDNSQTECMYLPAGSVTCHTTGGCTDPAQIDGTNFSFMASAFATDADDAGSFVWVTPSNLAGTTATIQFYWFSDNAACNGGADDDVCWVVDGDSFADDAAFETGTLAGTAVGVTDKCTADGDIMVSSAATFTHSYAADQPTVLVVTRDVDGGTSACAGAGDDDYTQDAKLVGVRVCYEVDNIFSGEN